MASGFLVPSLSLGASLSEAIVFGQANNSIKPDPAALTWTPPQFGKTAQTILSVIYPPFTVSSKQGSPVQIDYVFDAVFKLNHKRILRKTEHPVLSGVNISDHAYLLPTRVTLEIGMSDAMASYSDNMWTGASTKSISAWQIIKNFQLNRSLITLTTRLDSYSNMLVMDAHAPDDHRTNHGLRATVILEELISASVVSIQPSSARPQTTSVTSGGIVQSQNPSSSQLLQYALPSPQYPGVLTYPTVPGAGNVSSNILGQNVP